MRNTQNNSPEEVNVIAGRIVSHEELIPSHNMLSKARANSLIFRLGIPGLDSADTRLLGHRACFDISADARLIVAEQMRILFVQHAVNFEDVAIAGRALEFVASAIEAEDQGLLSREYVLSGLIGRVVACSIVLATA